MGIIRRRESDWGQSDIPELDENEFQAYMQPEGGYQDVEAHDDSSELYGDQLLEEANLHPVEPPSSRVGARSDDVAPERRDRPAGRMSKERKRAIAKRLTVLGLTASISVLTVNSAYSVGHDVFSDPAVLIDVPGPFDTFHSIIEKF